MHKVLVNRLGGLSLPRKSVVRLTDRPDMTLDVYRGRKTTIQHREEHTSQLMISPQEVDVLLKNINEDKFWCLFWGLGGLGAASLAGKAALAAMALPLGVAFFGLSVDVIAAVAAAGIGFATILKTLFGTDVVVKAVQGVCSHASNKVTVKF